MMLKHTFYSLCTLHWLLLFYSNTTPATCSNNETDFRALLAFRKAIDNGPVGAVSSWNETVHFCSWQGVLCSSRHQNRVRSINLMSQGLVGTLSPHLGNLSFLGYINIQNNSFYGQIPEEIGRLRRLEFVEFSNNSFSGEIPRNISNCLNVYYLNLIDNEITGTIIPEIGLLQNLRYLGLTRNHLSGRIPSILGNLTRLEQLSLAGCGLQGEIPKSLVQLRSLGLLNFVENNLTGRIPLGLYNISSVFSFFMRSNHLYGSIPSDVGLTLPILRKLDLGDNHFSGAIPFSLSNLSSLEYINLSANNFTGKIMVDFTRLIALRSFILALNPLEGDLSFISSMVNCTSLSRLYVFGNQLSGTLPETIGNLSSGLSFLSLAENLFHGRIPSSLGNLVGLTFFNVQNNDLEGPIPSTIGKLNKLQELNLRGNKLTSEIPFSFGNLTFLNHLLLGYNSLGGAIPHLRNYSNLLTMDISYNNLTGSIPRDIVSISSLSIYLTLAHNLLTGSIPTEISLLTNLGNLDLSHNRLSGLIPPSLSSCVRLEGIYVAGNSLHGEVPDALRTMRGVRNLDLSQNNLSGAIPRYFGELDLLYLNMSFNRLEGEIPTVGVFLNESAVSLEGNSDLCGGIPSLGFRPCPSENPKRKKFPTISTILILLVCAGVICIVISAYLFILNGRKSRDTHTSMVRLEVEHLSLSYADLFKATREFSETNLLGEGKFGSVYKGVLDDGETLVAVKVLNVHMKEMNKSFMSECRVLRGTRHRNLLRVVTVCSSTDFKGNNFKALIYEFMSNGNLDEWLHRKSKDESGSLGLRQRLNVAIDIASALEYLHFGTGTSVIHGDVKPSNVLLDGEMVAHLGDFGLARFVSTSYSTHESNSTGMIKGTIGYIPPEYGMCGLISTKGDVYSYGILLLEMFTGRRPTDDEFKRSSSLLGLVKSAVSSQVMEIVDPVILHDHKLDVSSDIRSCIVSILEIGLACSRESPRDRMLMTDVTNELHKLVSLCE